MNRYEIIFDIGYSIRIEKMQATLLSRIDRFMNFSQIFIGVAIISSWAPVATGVIVALIGAYSIVYQPCAKGIQALAQKQKYELLRAEEPGLEDDVLRQKFAAVQESDSPIIGALMNSAHLGEEIRGGHEPTIILTSWEKIVAWAAGDRPTIKNT